MKAKKPVIKIKLKITPKKPGKFKSSIKIAKK
jgi:hypothetical protein